MRSLLKCLLAVALVAPVMAFAGIKNSKHDLTFTGNSYYITGNATAELCAFCHVPHHAPSTQQLWNRSAPTGDGWGAGNVTSAGTPLPTAGNLSAQSKQCLSCHDGTIGLASVSFYHGVANTTIPGTMTGGANLAVTSYAYVNPDLGASANANHPVSVPMGNAAVYNGITSAAATGQYAGGTTTGCSGVAICPNTTGVTGANQVRLYGSAANPGVECGSCHEPHLTTNTLFLRVSNASSNLCLACHLK